MACKSCCRNNRSVRKGRWTPEEDTKLRSHILTHGIVCWRLVPLLAGLDRCGKSCRLRWLNYLRPGLRNHQFSPAEIALILHMHSILGNRWCKIAQVLPGRTDNDVKNFWNCYVKPRQKAANGGHRIAATQQQPPPFPPVMPLVSHDTKNSVAEEEPPQSFHDHSKAENTEKFSWLMESCQLEEQQLDYYWANDRVWSFHGME